jgi:Ca2+/Na+ antiporter
MARQRPKRNHKAVYRNYAILSLIRVWNRIPITKDSAIALLFLNVVLPMRTVNTTPLPAKAASVRPLKKNTSFQLFWLYLNTSRAQIHAAVLVPVVFGIWSLLLGADNNWDLRNYHLYNAFAFLHNKLGTDFAPAGFQSYFNPLLDIPYYLAINHLPPRLLGFLMGMIHGLNFVLVLAICRKLLSWLPETDRQRTPILLALAGCLTANFLSELGSTMGDNATALFCLASILVTLHAIATLSTRSAHALWTLAAAGVLAGMATGLKLTNAPYSVAICLGLLTLPVSPAIRIQAAFVFGVGVLAGLAGAAGFWFHTMWQTFGNPLFPQFGNLFPNPLAITTGATDTSWLPKTLWQQLLWPFIISADAKKAGQIPLRYVIWAIAYLLLILLALQGLAARIRKAATHRLAPDARFLVVVLVLGFILWMKIFSVYRYLVPMDLLAPLVIYLLCTRLLPCSQAKTTASWVIAIATLLVLLGGFKTWGHEGWSDKPFHVDVPALAEPARTTVLTTEDDPPWGWLVMAFPPEVAFAQVNGNFPKGPAFSSKIESMIAGRNGPVHALVKGEKDAHPERAARMKALADQLGLTSTPSRCAALQWVIGRFKLRASVAAADPAAKGAACQLQKQAPDPYPDINAENKAHQDKAQQVLSTYGYSLDPQSCSLHNAGIGDDRQMFQWCTVSRMTR